MDLKRTDIKQQNKNVNRLTFVFEHVIKYTKKTRSKTPVVKQMCLNGMTCRGTHQVKSQRTAMFIDHFLSY